MEEERPNKVLVYLLSVAMLLLILWTITGGGCNEEAYNHMVQVQ
jgi:hypothetical protein